MLFAKILWLLSFMIAWLPNFIQQLLINFGVVIYPVIAAKEYRRLMANIKLIYKLPAHSNFAKLFAKQNIRHQLISAIDTITFVHRPRLIQIDHKEEYGQALKKLSGSGVVIVTGHLGNWELLAHCTQLGYGKPLAVLAKPSRSEVLNAFLDLLRARLGSRVLWNDQKSVLRDMLTTLANDEALGFVMDQKPAMRQGIVVDFLGYPAEFVAGPATVVLKRQARTIAAFCIRVGARQYAMVFHEIPIETADVEVLTKQMAEAIANMIKYYPEQWTWNYKRWSYVAAVNSAI